MICTKYFIISDSSINSFLKFVVLRRDLLSEKEDLEQTANENKGGPYDPEIYRFPKQNIKDTLVVKDVTKQLLNSRLALATPGTCVT